MNQDNQDAHGNKELMEIPDIRTLKVLYTGDLKGEAEQMAKLATVLKQTRAAEPHTVLVDSGNWARGTLLSDSFKGMPMVEILSALEYDAVGIGKGEITFGSQNLYNIAGEAKFPLICVNLVESGTGIPPYFMDKKFVICERGPFIIGITAVAAPESYPGTGIEVKDPFTILPAVFDEMQTHKPDVIILLSGMGLDRDKALARAFPQITLIVGAGDEPLETPVTEGSTFIVRSGERAKFLGAIDIDMESVIKITSVE
jgi:2',3'-cyclic-nucleotide 2'-phosphodiesterase (5'-nucleotidase family)